VKLSVSLPEEDVEFLDTYAEEQGIESRSAALHKAVRMLRASQLADDYADAWEEWSADKTAAYWDAVASDGLAD
jgi:Arc/MetJ-type ribon-helix-helix transcriptional regulator